MFLSLPDMAVVSDFPLLLHHIPFMQYAKSQTIRSCPDSLSVDVVCGDRPVPSTLIACCTMSAPGRLVVAGWGRITDVFLGYTPPYHNVIRLNPTIYKPPLSTSSVLINGVYVSINSVFYIGFYFPATHQFSHSSKRSA